MKTVAVVLSGCGFLDGAEITEAVSTLVHLSQAGIEVQCFAPSTELLVIDHSIGEPDGEQRDVLAESARICRGKIHVLSALTVERFDGLVFPGGFGVAKNLCNWAEKGADCEVNEEIRRIIIDFYEQKKPICAMCIAPALIAKVLGKHGIRVTIGNDEATATEIGKTGAAHHACTVTQHWVDASHKIVSTPAYMYEAMPHEVFTGISAALDTFLELPD